MPSRPGPKLPSRWPTGNKNRGPEPPHEQSQILTTPLQEAWLLVVCNQDTLVHMEQISTSAWVSVFTWWPQRITVRYRVAFANFKTCYGRENTGDRCLHVQVGSRIRIDAQVHHHPNPHAGPWGMELTQWTCQTLKYLRAMAFNAPRLRSTLTLQVSRCKAVLSLLWDSSPSE